MSLAEQSGNIARVSTSAAPFDDRVKGEPTARLLDAVFANSREAVFLVDPDGGITYFTPGAGLLIGHDPASTTGSSVFEFLHPDDVDAAAQLFAQRLGYDGADLGHEIRIRHSSGEWISVVATAALLHDSDFGACAITLRAASADEFVDQSLRSQIVVAEYTNRLSAGFMESTASSEVLERIATSLGEIGFLTGAEIVEVFLEHEHSTSIERLAQWISPARIADEALSVSLTPDIQPTADRLLTDVQVIDDVRNVHASDIVDFTARAGAASMLSAPFRAGDQRGVLVLMRIVPGPAWIAADVELGRSAAGLFGRALETARSEELLALTYRQGPLGFSIRTWNGDLVDCNQQYLDLYGLTRDRANQINRLDLLRPLHRGPVAAKLDELRRGEIDRMRSKVEVTRGDGSRFWAQTHAVPLRVPGRSESLVLTSIEDVTEFHAQGMELEFAARHDSLTGVANRAAMSEEIERLYVRNGVLPAVIIADLDRFKLVNDSFGHDVGDEVLRTVAERIVTAVRPGDVVARLGGDEFAVILPRLTRDDASRLSERLQQMLDPVIEVDGRSVRQTMSIGVALAEGSQDAADLLKRADRALYAAKATGRNAHVVFDESLEDEVLARHALERELREALAGDQLEMHFQPEFSLVDGQVLGAEALLRWVHPHRGLIPAYEFIVVAEHSGLIDEIGRFALREACRAFVTIPGTDGLTLRVNISAREFSRPELPDLVEAALAESGLESNRLCLEMTETTLMDAPELALATFARLGALGVQSAIDDFGTGYSSLAYLKRFPVDAVKIDREFVNDVVDDAESRAIVESILGLADALSMEVVAEGVETVEQVTVLHDLGCLRAQGYLVSPALPGDQFEDFLVDWNHRPRPRWADDAN